MIHINIIVLLTHTSLDPGPDHQDLGYPRDRPRLPI